MAGLREVAEQMVRKGRGILAADESGPTIKKRFDAIKVESTEENRNFWRDLLFTSPGIENYISGVILYDETIRQSTIADRVPFAQHLGSRGILPGIKVDKGTKPLPGSPKETVTEGLDGLRERLQDYRGLGAMFAKWRAAIVIGHGLPTRNAIRVNAHALARYAALCQEEGLVPIVEPEVLMEGDHPIERSAEISRETFHAVFDELRSQGVKLGQMVLKPSMVLSGYSCPQQASPQEVARQTVECLLETVPATVPGIAFLSGGQPDEKATEHLREINRLQARKPWALTFSYGRGLQQAALQAWSGRPENRLAAQRALQEQARANGLATLGQAA